MSSLGSNFVPGKIITINVGNEKIYLELKEELGKGAFGTVLRGDDRRGVPFALKSILCKDNDTYESIARELDILLKLKHPNIVAMYGFDFHNYSAIIVMEYCGLGSLNKRLYSPVDIKLQLQWMDQLTTALTYLHNSNIVHRDLKTENVLLSEENHVKLADFGVARHFVCCRTGRVDRDPNGYISEYRDTIMGSFAGTPFWIAPEVFDNKYTEKADIFSLGVIFHAICERQFCTYENERYYGTYVDYMGQSTGIGLVMYEKQKMVEPEFNETMSKNIKTSIISMLNFQPECRLTLIDLRAEISEAYCDVLHGEKPPIIIENRDEHDSLDDVGGRSYIWSVFCCARLKGYEAFQ